MNLAERLVAKIAEERSTVVVIGDAILDRWVHGRIAECQDGCPKFVQESVYTTPGGAHNAEQCLQHWGINTYLYSFAEKDRPVKTRFVDPDGRIVFRCDDEMDSWAATRAQSRWAYDGALEMARHAGAVLLSDYDKGFLTAGFIRLVVDLCGRMGVQCVADAKRAPDTYQGCVVKGNEVWQAEHGNAVVTTHGKYPPTVGGCKVGTDSVPVACVNHVGAGDCFSAHLALALAYGFSLLDAAALAHSAGRVYVQHAHNRAPYPSEVSADLNLATVPAT